MGSLRRARRKVHFPKPAGGRTLCGVYITGSYTNTGIRTTANFDNVDCPVCRQHPLFMEALYEFEIGEYSWVDWLAKYAPSIPQLPNNMPFISWEEERKLREKFQGDRKALLAKFEARAKK